jgi:hypothetical protein
MPFRNVSNECERIIEARIGVTINVNEILAMQGTRASFTHSQLRALHPGSASACYTAVSKQGRFKSGIPDFRFIGEMRRPVAATSAWVGS